MRFRQNMGVKALAAFVMFAVAQISVQIGFAVPNTSTSTVPAAQQYIARLRTRGNNAITVNSNAASTGATIVTGALIETGADEAATIDIGDFSLDIAPNTKLRLDFDDQGKVKVFLITGCLIAKSKGKTETEIQTADNVTQGKTECNRAGAVDLCFINGNATVNQNAAANAGAGAGSSASTSSAGGGLSSQAVALIVLVVAGGVIGAVALSGDDDTQANPSPSSPSR